MEVNGSLSLLLAIFVRETLHVVVPHAGHSQDVPEGVHDGYIASRVSCICRSASLHALRPWRYDQHEILPKLGSECFQCGDVVDNSRRTRRTKVVVVAVEFDELLVHEPVSLKTI